MVEVFAVKVDKDIDKIEFEMLMSLVGHEKRERILKFRRNVDAQMCLIADIFIRKLVGDKLHIENHEICFEKGEKGKPRLERDDFGLEFNYSHSGEWILCAIGKNIVGIDVERVQNIDINIAKRFFSPQEYEDLMEFKGMEQLEYFFDLWTLKESYVKWDGAGLSIGLSEFSFKLKDDGIIDFESEKHSGDCFFKQFDIGDNYKVSLCSSEREICEDVRVFSLDEVIAQMNFK